MIFEPILRQTAWNGDLVPSQSEVSQPLTTSRRLNPAVVFTVNPAIQNGGCSAAVTA